MSFEALREVVTRLGASAYALSAVGAALEARTSGATIPPEVGEPLDAVVTALGLRDALAGVTAVSARPLLGEIRMALFHGLRRLAPCQSPGWSPGEPAVLQAAGDVSAGFPALLQRLVPRLDGLAGRLASDGASFLDVGVGAGVLAVEMVRLWPALRVVGIDCWAPALALARDNVARAGLAARIELREQAVEELPDANAFDLAWLPSVFIPGRTIPEALRRVHRSLRPGGWVLFAAVNPAADPLAVSLARLRTVEWGACPWTPPEAERLLEQAGFVEIAALPGPPSAAVAFIAGRVALAVR
jgi:SAM-dependent methyltransferase